MDKEQLIQRLMATFLGELEEHAQALSRDLLALEKNPPPEARAELVKTLFRTAHSLKGAARAVNVGPIEKACHGLEGILAAVRDGTTVPSPGLFQLLFAAADAIRDAGVWLRQKRDLAGGSLAALIPRLQAAASGEAEPYREPAPQPAAGGPTEAAPAGSGSTGFVRLPAAKLDALLARSGELLVARGRTRVRGGEAAALQESMKQWQAKWQAAEKHLSKLVRQERKVGTDTTLDGQSGICPYFSGRRPAASQRKALLVLEGNRENLHRLGRDLERLATGMTEDRHLLEQAAGALDEEVRRARMLPFAVACEGLERMARDLALARGKEVELSIEGGEVGLDRSILEGLKDPLLHLVRNAVDHGVEPPAARASAGKPPRGRVRVGAALRGSLVEIVVTDDGQGLDLGAVREQIRRKGLAEPAGEREAAQMIFAPGFSTARQITELSGRGVGLDVVKTRVEALRGAVGFTTETGRGMCFTLTVPLTLTTVRALLVTAGGETFALLGTAVEKLVRVTREDLCSVEGREMLRLGETPVPVASLAATLGLPARERAGGSGRTAAVVLADGAHRAAFVVDELLAEQEVLVQGLGARLLRVGNIAGATVLPNGRVALILNASEVIRSALRRAPAERLAASSEEEARAARKRVLVVEDSVTTRTLERSILEAAGYEVAVAVDGVEAWQVLQERGTDVVVADVEMPRLDGFALTEAIRGSKRFRDLPVILLTALETERDKARGLAVGADAYLVKSAFDQKNLIETITQLL